MGVLGPKTIHLKTLEKLGFNVPAFIGIAGSELKDFAPLAARIKRELPCTAYAVRSSALIEDQSGSSQAGQFLTLLAVKPIDLVAAMQKVTTHASKKLKGNRKQFSLLIQDFIEPDFAGVFFTRDPSGGREWVIEYHRGRGEEVVGGRVKPQMARGIWGGASEKVHLPAFSNILKQIRLVEEYFGSAQDLEWCIKDETWYFLQTRPVSTLTKMDYVRLLGLDQTLPLVPFFYQKTEISEIAPRPDQETLKLLKSIYRNKGPIHKVYQKWGIDYEPIDFLRLVEGELYIDRESELKTLLPAYSFLNGKQVLERPRLSFRNGLLRTFKNAWRLHRLSGEPEEHFALLSQALNNKKLNSFDQDYELIFEVNLLSSFYLSRLQVLLRRFPLVSLAGVLQLERFRFPHLKAPKGLLGNALDLQDTSPFLARLAVKSDAAERWWESLTPFQKKLLLEPLSQAVRYAQLREYARWLLVSHANLLRPAKKRKKGSQLPLVLPQTLSNYPYYKNTTLLCLSAGSAQGPLLTLEQVKAGRSGILFTKMLTPDLVRYFPNILGILSEEGGLLSHLAIMARENKIPVLSGFHLGDQQVGDLVLMNADETTVSCLPS